MPEIISRKSCCLCFRGGYNFMKDRYLHKWWKSILSLFFLCLFHEVKWSRSVVSNSLRLHGLKPTSLLHLSTGFFRQEYWSGLPFPPGRSSRPRDKTQVSLIVGRTFTIWATREVLTKDQFNFTYGRELVHFTVLLGAVVVGEGRGKPFLVTLSKIAASQSCMDVRVGLWRKLSAEELMLLNCGVGEYSGESLGLQGDPTSPS